MQVATTSGQTCVTTNLVAKIGTYDEIHMQWRHLMANIRTNASDLV